MISVAFYLRQLDVGGVQTGLLRLAGELPQTRYRVRIYVQQPGGELRSRLPAHIRLISLNVRSTLRSVLPLVRSMRSDPPDILVSGLIHGNIAIVAAASCVRGVRTVVTEHAPPRSLIRSCGGWRFRFLPPLIRRAYRRADAVIAVSRGVRSELQELVPGIAVQVIANPVVPNNLAELANSELNDPWLGQDSPPLLLGVGRLEPSKRFDVLISAFARLARDWPGRLLILGEGSARSALEAQIQMAGLASRARLAGYVDNPFPYMKAARMLAVTSEFEGFCNVLVEAMACGTQVVSTDCPVGPREILAAGRYGRLVPVNDSAALDAAIRSALADPLPANLLIDRALDFSVSRSVTAYAELFERIVAKGQVSEKRRGAQPTAGSAQPGGSERSGTGFKAAIYMNDLASGGAERMMLAMIPMLRQRGADVTLLLHTKKGELAPTLPDDLPVISFETRRTLSDVQPLARYLRNIRPDILLASLAHNNIAALLAKAIAGGPSRVIICQHNALSSEAGQRATLKFRVVPLFYRWLAAFAAGIVAVSRGVADDLAATCGIRRDRITVIYNPVMSENFNARVDAVDTHPWLEDGQTPVFITVGRLVPQKNHELLLEALALVREQAPARLLVLGQGPLRTSLAAKSRSLGIEAAVDFLGFRENPLPLIKRASALVLSSDYEGFGNVVVEALGCGTPVISTDCPFGPAEILADGRFGRLVPVRDARALARAMASPLRAQWSREELRSRAEIFSVDAAVDRYMQLFAACLGTQRPAALSTG
jgi:glycosyltransferase involved in cell wall biosynthesis